MCRTKARAPTKSKPETIDGSPDPRPVQLVQCRNWFAAAPADAATSDGGAVLWVRISRNDRNKRPYPVVSPPGRVGKL